MKRRQTVILLMIGLLALSASWYFWSGTEDQPQYKTAKLERGAIVASVSASGTVNPVVSVQVGSQVSGQLKEIYVDFNSEVKQGQVIARIDPETFEHRVRQAQADLEAAHAQAAMQQATVAVQKAQAAQAAVNAANARRDLDRKQNLMEKGFISGAERDTVQATYQALAEQVKAANAQVQVAQSSAASAAAGMRQRQAALAQARIDLERTAIKAPVNGIVIKRSVEKGQTVAASLQAPELFIIAQDLTAMRVETAIDESEIGRIRDGQEATFTVDAFPGRTFQGTVKQIRKAAQNVSNVITYMVEVTASNPDRELLPGMTANVRIVTDRRDDILKVQNAALRFRPAAANLNKQTSQGTGSTADSSSDKRETASVDTAGTSAGSGQGGQSRALRSRIEQELDLSAEQKAKLDPIFDAMREKMTAARGVGPDERKKIAARNRAELREEIGAILTPEQKKRFEAMNAEQGARSSGAAGSGRIYVMHAGRPKEIQVLTGLSDGRMTEISGPEVKEGLEVIIGTVQQDDENANKRQGMPAGPRMF